MLSSQERGEHHFSCGQNLLAVRTQPAGVPDPGRGAWTQDSHGIPRRGAAGYRRRLIASLQMPAGPCSRLGPSCRCGEDEQRRPLPSRHDSQEGLIPRVSAPHVWWLGQWSPRANTVGQGREVSSSWSGKSSGDLWAWEARPGLRWATGGARAHRTGTGPGGNLQSHLMKRGQEYDVGSL